MIVETLMEMQKKWENKGLRKGKQIGAQETRIKTATQLLKEGLDVEFIARVTGLSQKEIETLKKNLG